jgi:ADP-ribose pyrophosphatase YjhB (NUDIX family)
MERMRQPVIFAASAVVWRGRQVLLVKRGRPPGKDYWSLPGGKVEAGETVEQTAAREVLEETGLAAKLLGLIGVFTVVSAEVEYRISCFAAMSDEGEVTPGDDAADAAWFSFVDLEKLKLAPNTLEAILQSQRFIKA